MNGLFWLAFSESERQQAQELVRALQQKESRDELGIGTIRDALSDLFFPGTSTLHTRARYHLFIPWAYKAVAGQHGKTPFATRLREQEGALISALCKAPDQSGLIGRQAGASLQRMPSELYWQGLLVWGVRRAGGTSSAIVKLMLREQHQAFHDDDGERVDVNEGTIWHQNLPPVPPAFPEDAAFALTYNEADFLAERLRTEPGTRNSALTQLVELRAGDASVSWIWEHPRLTELTTRTREAIEQARRFSLLMHGAALIYNVVLAQMRESNELESEHQDTYTSWVGSAEQERNVLTGWELSELWSLAGRRVGPMTRRFVTRWHQLLRENDAAGLVDSVTARSLIVERERSLKRANARTLNPKALAQWGGRSAVSPLDFRWGTARGLIKDICDGRNLLDAPH